jgi:hypothetical protein
VPYHPPMRRITVVVAIGLSIAAGGAAESQALLSAGHKLKAVQFCHSHKAPKGLGVTLFIRSVSEDGTRAQVGVAVNCWGDQACTSENCSQHTFKGSLTVDGDSATLVFRDDLNPGRGLHDPIRGHVETREGKPAIVFGKSVMQFTEGPAETRELIFQ